jgi:putative transferase (TIGR04331 family)
MLLVTTPDQRFWKTGQKILFLGEWCRLYSQKNVWSKLNHEVLPYHWNDREKLYKDYQYLSLLYEAYLIQLAEQLNNLHRTDFSLRYWRIVVGPWLYNFIEILYDRYLSICAAEKTTKVTDLLLPKSNASDWIVKDLPALKEMGSTDPFNQYLYSEIIRFSGKLSYNTIDCPVNNQQETHRTDPHSTLKGLFINLSRKLNNLWPNQINQIIFVHSYIKPMDLIRLQLSLGQYPTPYPPVVETKSFPINKLMREKTGKKTKK